MNKNFKKLLEQSYAKGFEVCAKTGHRVGQLDTIFNSIVMCEFAESIVRECVEVCKSRVGNSDYNTGRMHCASDLKEHFGVEE